MSSSSHAGNAGLYVFMASYVLALFVVALLAWRRKQSAKKCGGAVSAQYGGSFNPVLLILTTFASVFSGYTVTGVPAEATVKGYFAVRWIPAISSVALGILVYYPRLRRISVVRGYKSPNDFVADRYRCQLLRVLCSFCACVPQFFYLTVQLVSFASLLNGLTLGVVPKWVGMLGFTIVTLSMEIVGGMHSVVLSDALQAVLMIAGFAAMLIVLTARYGTLSQLAPADCSSLDFVNMSSLAQLKAAGDLSSRPALCASGGAQCQAFGCVAAARPEFLEYPSHVQQASYFFFVANFLAFPLNPHMVQRAYVASSDRAVRLVAMVLTVAGFITMPPGIVAGIVKATFGESWPLASQNAASFSAISSELMRMGGVEYALVAVLTSSALAAIMSTADSVILGVANTLSIDIYQRLLAPGADSHRVVRFGTAVSVAMLAGGNIWGNFLTPADFGTLLTVQNGILLQIGPAYALGLYFNVTTRAVTAGVVTGLLVFFIALAWNPLGPYVPAPDVGALANFATLAMGQLLGCRGEGIPDKTAQGAYGEKLTVEEIRRVMEGTSEPNKLCLLVMLVLLVLSTPLFREPGAAEPLVMGFPRWAVVVMVLQVFCGVLGLLAASRWRPINKEGTCAPQPCPAPRSDACPKQLACVPENDCKEALPRSDVHAKPLAFVPEGQGDLDTEPPPCGGMIAEHVKPLSCVPSPADKPAVAQKVQLQAGEGDAAEGSCMCMPSVLLYLGFRHSGLGKSGA